MTKRLDLDAFAAALDALKASVVEDEPAPVPAPDPEPIPSPPPPPVPDPLPTPVPPDPEPAPSPPPPPVVVVSPPPVPSPVPQPNTITIAGRVIELDCFGIAPAGGSGDPVADSLRTLVAALYGRHPRLCLVYPGRHGSADLLLPGHGLPQGTYQAITANGMIAVVAVPAVFDANTDGTDRNRWFDRVLSGADDAQHRAHARWLLDQGQPNARLRIGWEGGLPSFPWSPSVRGEITKARLCRMHVAEIYMREGPQFAIIDSQFKKPHVHADGDPNRDIDIHPDEIALPPLTHCHIRGVDWYPGQRGPLDAGNWITQANWQAKFGQITAPNIPWGPDTWCKWAHDAGLPFEVDEHGIFVGEGLTPEQKAACDDPVFITVMHQQAIGPWRQGPGMAGLIYFHRGAGNPSRLHPTTQAGTMRATEAYKALHRVAG